MKAKAWMVCDPRELRFTKCLADSGMYTIQSKMVIVRQTTFFLLIPLSEVPRLVL